MHVTPVRRLWWARISESQCRGTARTQRDSNQNNRISHRLRSVHSSIEPEGHLQPKGTLTAPNLQSVTRNCMNHPSQRERQSSRKQSRRRFWCPVVEYHKASGSGRQHNQVIQPEDNVTIVINSPPPLELF